MSHAGRVVDRRPVPSKSSWKPWTSTSRLVREPRARRTERRAFPAVSHVLSGRSEVRWAAVHTRRALLGGQGPLADPMRKAFIASRHFYQSIRVLAPSGHSCVDERGGWRDEGSEGSVALAPLMLVPLRTQQGSRRIIISLEDPVTGADRARVPILAFRPSPSVGAPTHMCASAGSQKSVFDAGGRCLSPLSVLLAPIITVGTSCWI